MQLPFDILLMAWHMTLLQHLVLLFVKFIPVFGMTLNQFWVVLVLQLLSQRVTMKKELKSILSDRKQVATSNFQEPGPGSLAGARSSFARELVRQLSGWLAGCLGEWG